MFDEHGRFVTAILRPAKRPKGTEIRAHLRRIARQIRANWPQVEILLRADSHYCCPEVLNWCRTNRLDYVLGLAPTSALRRHILGLEASIASRFAANSRTAKIRRFKEFHDAAGSWNRTERIIARVEVGPQGLDTRFIVTSLRRGRWRWLYEELYSACGQAENHIKTGRRTSPPIAPPATRPPPTSSGCSCMPAPTGCCGRCAS